MIRIAWSVKINKNKWIQQVGGMGGGGGGMVREFCML